MSLGVRERHPVRFERMSPHFGDELALVLGSSLEPAVAMEYVPRHERRR
jgi:hypothetical protein